MFNGDSVPDSISCKQRNKNKTKNTFPSGAALHRSTSALTRPHSAFRAVSSTQLMRMRMTSSLCSFRHERALGSPIRLSPRKRDYIPCSFCSLPLLTSYLDRFEHSVGRCSTISVKSPGRSSGHLSSSPVVGKALWETVIVSHPVLCPQGSPPPVNTCGFTSGSGSRPGLKRELGRMGKLLGKYPSFLALWVGL